MFEKVVWLTGMPRSGTNWFSQILASSPDVRMKFCPLFSYEFKNSMSNNCRQNDWREFFEKVYVTESEYLDQEYLRKDGFVPDFSIKSQSPKILGIKSTRFHLLTRTILENYEDIQFVALVRNPCAVINSWINNPLEFPEDANPKVEWRTGKCRKIGDGEFWGFDDWMNVTNMHLELAERFPDRMLIVKYEEYVGNLLENVEGLFSWLELPMTQQTYDFVESSQKKHVDHERAVFKPPSTMSKWKKSLDNDIREEIISEITGTKLEQFLL